MSRLSLALSATALLLASACVPPADEPATPAARPASLPVVGGATMLPTLSIVQNLEKSNEHKTLMAALETAGLKATLAGTSASYTLFAPTDAAFRQLPPGTVQALMQPRSRPELSKVLNYHVIPGSKTRVQIEADARAAGGTAAYRTLQGSTIRVGVSSGSMIVTDVNGRRSAVTIPDVRQSNGTVHVLRDVLLPAIP